MVKTLIFAQGQTREGMKWKLTEVDNNAPVDLTDSTINILVFDANDRVTVIIGNPDNPKAAEILLPATLGEAQYIFVSPETDRAGTYEVELNPINFSDGSVGILDDMRIVIKPVGVGT